MVRSRQVLLYTEVVIIILVSLMGAYGLKHHFIIKLCKRTS
jgi:hypothetical protein